MSKSISISEAISTFNSKTHIKRSISVAFAPLPNGLFLRLYMYADHNYVLVNIFRQHPFSAHLMSLISRWIQSHLQYTVGDIDNVASDLRKAKCHAPYSRQPHHPAPISISTLNLGKSHSPFRRHRNRYQGVT